MKKRIFTFAAATALVMSLTLTSCSKSNASLINDYREATQEFVEAIQAGDSEKVQKISEKVEKISNELGERDLTPEEKQEIVQISVEAAGAAFGGMGNF